MKTKAWLRMGYVFVLVLGLCLSAAAIHADAIKTLIVAAHWSPDGAYIAYLSSEGIYVMDRQGQGKRRIAPPSGFGGWTGDSRGLFIIENDPAEGTLSWWVHALDGSEPTPFLPQMHSIQALAYSHDGTQMALSAQAPDSEVFQIWRANADGSQLEALADYQAFALRWSEDDVQILFDIFDGALSEPRIEVAIDVRGTAAVQERPYLDGIRSLGEGLDFRYDPDTSYLPATVYITDFLDQQVSLFTVNQWVDEIVYSDRSRRIVYSSYCDAGSVDPLFLRGEWWADEQARVATALYVFDPATAEARALIPCGSGSQRAISWSPDGQDLLFVGIQDQHWAIYRLSVAEARLINLSAV